ncbi:type II toxin-antitoxin system PemK/MazF family toxin [Marinoscillum furvescens]|uniref:mRNA interferase n=1 Tax=Marinoscillum furvescens DSM 4134 TaxID=1122208 RepID=A0A3D9L4T1_MARFU|nr:type II toxin-antitoxin system PemK/MazF family toxin [Marinoscillum furvescens]RED99805.1 mRNA interferase MazF [Marinoscillum furvescens DSM 4134]
MKQGEIWYTDLEPTKGSEQSGFRPVVILSGNMMNELLSVVIVCPLTSSVKGYKGNLVLEPNSTNNLPTASETLIFHIRSLAKMRLKRKIGTIEPEQIDFLKTSLNKILTY